MFENVSADEFRRHVDLDIRGESPQEVHDWLRSRKYHPHWVEVLKNMKSNIEWQLANDRAARAEKRVQFDKDGYLIYIAERERWRANTLKVLQGIERCLVEAKSYLDGSREWCYDEERF